MKREQGRDFETHINTRQDRNSFVTGGGTLTWDESTDTLSWTSPIYIRVGTKAVHTVAGPSSLGGVDATHKAIYGVLDRDTPGAVSLVVADLGSAPLDTDGAYVVAIRGADNKLYFSNGSIFFPADSKPFGTLAAATDRDDQLATALGNPYTVAFAYVVGSDQLAVYVGGFLQRVGVDYTETDPTTVTFLAGSIPSPGELITFLNVAGGQGPPGTVGGLNDSYLAGPLIDIAPGVPVQLDSTGGGNTSPLLRGGNAISAGGLEAFYVLRNGAVALNRLLVRDGALDFWAVQGEPGVDDFMLVSTLVASEYGIKVAKDGSGIEFGSYPAGGPWVPQEGGGFLRWVVYEGLLDVGTAEFIGAGLDPTKVLGATISVLDSLGNADLLTRSVAPADSELYVILEPGGDIYISGDTTTYTTTPVGLRYQNRAFKLVVFLSN